AFRLCRLCAHPEVGFDAHSRPSAEHVGDRCARAQGRQCVGHPGAHALRGHLVPGDRGHRRRAQAIAGRAGRNHQRTPSLTKSLASTKSGPTHRYWRSSKNEGFLPSILCPMNWAIHASTNTATDTGNSALPSCWTTTTVSRETAAIVARKTHEPSRA